MPPDSGPNPAKPAQAAAGHAESHGGPGRASSPGAVAAGLTSLRVTFEHARAQTGLGRALRVLGRVNQKHGFDCPGCAWPDPASRSFAEFCENGAKAVLDEATTHRIGREFFRQHSIDALAAQPDRWLNAQGRITEPLILREGSRHYEPIDYEAALDLLAEHLAGLDQPNRAAFYTSGRTSNEAAFLYQLVARSLGTNNLPDCSNLCHESSGVALKETLGIGKGTVRLEDFAAADLIFVIGQNPGTNHPRMLSTLREAKAAGATIVSVNPLRELGLVRFAHPQHPIDVLEGGVSLADEHLRVRVNGDLALFRGLNKALVAARATDPHAIDDAFIREHTLGFDEFSKSLEASGWQEIEERSGISRAEIERMASMTRASNRIICCWAMGLTQHQNAVATIQEVVSFLLLRGNVGRPGAGACPVRGHSNVQGDRTVGIASTMPESFYLGLERAFGIHCPREPGLDTVSTITAMTRGEVDVFVALGGNFLSASPDTDFTARALGRCKLTAHVATKLNRSHLAPGHVALLLPCLGRTEVDRTGGSDQLVSVENSMGIVHTSRGHLPPAAPGLWSEPRIVAELGARITARKPSGSLSTERWHALGQDYDAIRGAIESVVAGFSDYNVRLREPGGFELPNGPRERRFTTASGRAHFASHALSGIEPEPDELVLTTVRSHDQFNTTVYTDDDRYRGVSGNRRVLLLAPEDMAERGISTGTTLRIESRFEGTTRTVDGFAALPYEVPRGTAVAYFPEANALIPIESFAAQSRTPTSKSVCIRISVLATSAS